MLRRQRKIRIRRRLRSRSDRPRLTVFRSLKFIYAQIIDDRQGQTLAAAFGREPKAVGEQVAKAAGRKKIVRVVFDRGPYRYHGRIKALADAARAAGLEF